MAIDNIVLTDEKTGNKIYPRSSYNNLDDIPENLLNTDYLNVGDSDTQLPVLGSNVTSVAGWSSRTISLNGFKMYFFNGYFNIKKEMFTSTWKSDARILFYLPTGIIDDNLNYQPIYGRSVTDSSMDSLIFRTFNDPNNISFDTFNKSTDPNNFPDVFGVQVSGFITSHI